MKSRDPKSYSFTVPRNGEPENGKVLIEPMHSGLMRCTLEGKSKKSHDPDEQIQSQDDGPGPIRFLYALASMRESPGTLVGAAIYAILIPAWISGFIAGISGTVIPIEIQLSIGIVVLVLSSFIGAQLRNQPGYVEFLATWTTLRRGFLRRQSMRDSLPGLRWHFKSIARIANRMTLGNFDAIVKADQLARKETPKSPLTYDQITYGIELGIVCRSQNLPESRFQEPVTEYKNEYVRRFQGQNPTSRNWASFLVDYFEGLPKEVKTIAASRKSPSFYGQLYPHIRFWHLVATFIGAVLLLWVTISA